MDINYELYKVFYYVATSLSFSDASKKLFISQSAVSQSIKTLEKKLGQSLFIRRASDTICRYFLLPYLKQFHKAFPNVPIKITNATSIQCVNLLEQRKVDLIVTNFPNSHLNHAYIQKTVCNFSDVFIANPAYFNLKQQEIPFEELQQYPIMMLDRNSTTSEFLHNLFLQHQLELIPQVELSSNDLLIDMARIGLGIAFIPDFCLSRESNDLFVLRTKEKMPTRQIVVSANTTLPVSASTEEFLKLLPDASPF